jgi:hypothetical protein
MEVLVSHNHALKIFSIMSFIKKNRRTILIIILYFALFMVGQELYELLNYGLNPKKNSYIQLSGLIGNSFLAFGCFWELYFAKTKKK